MQTVYDLTQRVFNLMNNTGLDYDQALETIRVYEEIKRG